MEKDFKIYEVMKAHALNVFAHVTARPGVYSLADLAKINDDKKAEGLGLGWAEGFDAEELLSVDVDGFACSYPAKFAFSYACQFEKFAGVATRDRASFTREADTTGAPVFAFTVDGLSVDAVSACAKDPLRVVLNGVFVDVINNNVVACDGHVMNVARCKDLSIYNADALQIVTTGNGLKYAGVILTADFMKKAKGQGVTVYAEGSGVHTIYKAVATNGAACECIIGRYPAYINVFPRINEAQGVRFAKNLKALKKAAQALMKAQGVDRLTLSGVSGENYITISCRDIFGKNELSKNVATVAPVPATFAFYVDANGLKAVNAGAYDTIYFTESSRAAVLSGAQVQAVGLILPSPFSDARDVLTTNASQWARDNATEYNGDAAPLECLGFLAPAADVVTPQADNNEAPEPAHEDNAPRVDVATTDNEADNAPRVAVVDETPAADVATPQADNNEADTNEDNERPELARFLASLNKRDASRARDILTKTETRDGVTAARWAFVFAEGVKYSYTMTVNARGSRAHADYIQRGAGDFYYIATKYEYLFAKFVGVTVCTPEYKEYIDAKINYHNNVTTCEGWGVSGFMDRKRAQWERLSARAERGGVSNMLKKDFEELEKLIKAADAFESYKDNAPREFSEAPELASEDNAPHVAVVDETPAADVVTPQADNNEAPELISEDNAPHVDVVPVVDVVTTNEADTLTTDNEADNAPHVAVVDVTPAVDVVTPQADNNEAPELISEDNASEDNAPRLTLRALHWLTAAAVVLCLFVVRFTVNTDTNAHEAPHAAVVDTLTTNNEADTLTADNEADNAPHVAVVDVTPAVDVVTPQADNNEAPELISEDNAPHVDALTTDNEADTLTADTLTNEAPHVDVVTTNEADTLTTDTLTNEAPAVDVVTPQADDNAPGVDAEPVNEAPTGTAAAFLPFLFPLVIGRAKNQGNAPRYSINENLQTFNISEDMKTTIATPNALQTLASMATATADRLSNWLTNRHDLSNEEGEILLTGWQLIALYSGVTLAALFLSVNW